MKNSSTVSQTKINVFVNIMMAIEFTFCIIVYFALLHLISPFAASCWLVAAYAWELKASYDKAAISIKDKIDGKTNKEEEKHCKSSEDSKDIDT